TTKAKIKRRKGRKANDLDKENAPPIGGVKDAEPRSKRAIKALNKGGMDPLPFNNNSLRTTSKYKWTRSWMKLQKRGRPKKSKVGITAHPVNALPDQPPEHRKCTINQSVGDNNQICTIIDSVNTTITINSSPTYLPGTETSTNLNIQDLTYIPDSGPSLNLNTQDPHLPELESKLEFDEMRRAISDAFTDTFTDLPVSPNNIPDEIREELPFELLIFDRANTRPIARCTLTRPQGTAPATTTTATNGDNKPKLPDTVEEIKEILFAGKEDTTDTQEIELLITTHATFTQTIKLLRDHFSFNGIPNHIINLPLLPAPSWENFNRQ
ncbi:23472_t:CDS:2, partial [Gigaspora rosea]